MNEHIRKLAVILSLSKSVLRTNPYFTIFRVFIIFVRCRLDRLSKVQTCLRALSDNIFYGIAASLDHVSSTNFLTYESCALGKLEDLSGAIGEKWLYICSNKTRKKYKIRTIPYEDCPNDSFITSETTRRNIENALGHKAEIQSFFVIPAEPDRAIAAQTNISMISHPYDCPINLIDCALKTYFASPHYARQKDIFAVNTKKYTPEYFFSMGSDCPRTIYFLVNSLSIRSKGKMENTNEGCYIIKGETSLLQSSNIFSYLPSEMTERTEIEEDLPIKLQIEISLLPNCPPFLEKPLAALSTCIAPFLQKDNKLKIRPAFLVKGPAGSGKFKLVDSLAKRNGLNLLNVDFSEIQCPSAVQTEAKLRIILQNARASVPCILRLSNVQIFGKNSEGKKDERIVRAFRTELEKLCEKTSDFPTIIVSSLENEDLEADIERLFIDTITIEHPTKSERAETLEWRLKTSGHLYSANLLTIAGLVSDFRLADLEALVMQTAKIAYESLAVRNDKKTMILTDAHFVEAYELMQNTFSDRDGSPRIPKVYWEDIGGLANLKHEIKRRIELPMFNTMGLGRSGLLLHGPPGTGKTLLAKAVATECQLHFMSVKGPELLNMYVGQSEQNVRQVFERARAASPCVIFFDELDSLAPNRGRSGDSGGVMDRVVSQLLAEMDGLESSGNIFIIGATNRLDLIDPALLRPGRFDKMLYVGIYEDSASKVSVLRAVTRRFNMEKDTKLLEDIAEKLPKNLTGADLYAVCSDAWLSAVRRNIEKLEEIEDEGGRGEFLKKSGENGIIVKREDFLEACGKLVPSLSSVELIRYEKIGMEFSSTR